jgi:hypothetical protein
MHQRDEKGNAVFKRLFRLLLLLVVVGALIWFLAPRIFNSAANSLISSTTSQAQGLAQFVPADVSSANKGDLQINLTGLTPNTTYQLTLDQVQCGMGVSTSLGQATSDANGSFYVEFPLTSIDTRQTWYVDVLQDGQSVACGLLQTNQNVSSQVINASQSGPNVFGPQGSPSAQPTQDAQNQANSTPTPGATPTANSDANNKPVKGLPNTGVDSGGNQQYDNNQYPRKY